MRFRWPTLFDSRAGLRLESGIRLGGMLFAAVVVVATLAHVWLLDRAIETEIQGRARTLSRILANEVNRSLASIQGSIDQSDEALRSAWQRADVVGMQTLLEGAAQSNALIRELSLVGGDGRVLASSRQRSVGLVVSGYEFFGQVRDGKYRLGLASEGRGLSGDQAPRQGAAYARQGFLTLSRSLQADGGIAQIVAVIGTDSLMNALRFVAADEDEVLSVYRYDGQLLAASASAVLQRGDPQPIFARFIPERETGQFTDMLADGSRWLAHFDTTPDFAAIAEVRIARSLLTERRVREQSVPLLVMAAMLLAVFFYTRIALRSLARRRASEEAAATQGRRLRNILDSAADGIVTIDERGVVRDYNQAAEQIFGIDAAGAIGRPLADLLPPADGREHQNHVLRYLTEGRGSVIGRGRVLQTVRYDGRPLEIHLAVSEVVDQGERLFTGIVRDITDSRTMERELERHRDHLEEMVAARTVELQASQLEAERLSRVKGEFLAKMSHEIRTPLNAVLGLAQIGARSVTDTAAVPTFKRILDAGQHLLAVINDILDVSRLDAGMLSLESRPFQLAGTVERLSRLIAPGALARGLQWSVSLAPDLPVWVMGDEARITQILTNLLANAVKFTEAGAVSLAIAMERDAIVFRVSDTGIGIPAAQLPRLFTPFDQLDNTVTRKYGGSGLGLAISRDLARLMAGTLEAESREGEGSVFTLSLPLPIATAPAAAAADLTLPGGRLKGIRLLAAEDVEVNRLVLEGMLQHEEALVSFAENGAQALARIVNEGALAFDAVLMDIQMPVMDGFEATREIRLISQDLPIIGLTAHALPAERDRSLAAGMVAHLAKPIDIDELVATVLRYARLATVPPAPAASTAAAAPAEPSITPDAAPSPSSASSAPALVSPAPPAAASTAPSIHPIDWPALQVRLNGNRALVERLASLLLTGYRDLPAEIQTAIDTGDAAQLRFLAHKLKGLFAELGLRQASEQAALAEVAARNQDAGAGRRLAALRPQVDDLFRQAQDFLASPSAAAPSASRRPADTSSPGPHP